MNCQDLPNSAVASTTFTAKVVGEAADQPAASCSPGNSVDLIELNAMVKCINEFWLTQTDLRHLIRSQ